MNLDIATTKRIKIGTSATKISSITNLTLLSNMKRLTEII